MTTSRRRAVAISFQSGITNRPPEHNLLLALQFAGDAANSPEGARAAIEALREVVRRELRSQLDPEDAATPKDQPSPETGELGFASHYDRAHLTITFGLSSTGFNHLGTPSEQRPQDLIPIPWDKLQDTPTLTVEQGDCILQICSDDIYICEHVARRVEEELGGQFSVVWTMLGSQRYTTRQGRTSRREGRALIGFIDGTSNLDPRNTIDDWTLIFVDPTKVSEYPVIPQPANDPYTQTAQFPTDLRTPPQSEPGWTKFGSYMAVRASLQPITDWDDRSLGEQEATIGQFKYSGAFLDLTDDPNRLGEPPVFAGDPANTTVPVTSHTRKVNPRRPDDAKRRVFRRGYPIVLPTSGGMQRGLMFICFARSLSTQFEFIVRAWMKNEHFPSPGAGKDRLLSFENVVLCGGYYFIPPIEHRTEPWTWILPTT
jgi:deferrochelatase/peroxidase EfeB